MPRPGRAPLSSACMMSRLVTRPASPEPLSAAISIPCSAAILRTRGEDFVRSRPSNVEAAALAGAPAVEVALVAAPAGDGACVGAADGCWAAEAGVVACELGGAPAVTGADFAPFPA